MAVNPILLNARLKVKRASLQNSEKEIEKLESKKNEILRAAEDAKNEEDVNNVQKESDDVDKQIETLKKDVDQLKTDVKDIESKLDENNGSDEKEETGNEEVGDDKRMKKIDPNQAPDFREKLVRYLKTNGQKRDGLTTSEYGALIPKSIIYKAADEVKTDYDLRKFIDVIPVKTAGGTFNVAKKVDARFVSVEELEANPKLAKPGLNEINWNVKTYRGALPYSEEFVQDAESADYLIKETVAQYILNTSNYAIAENLKTATAKAVTDIDDLKKIVNVDLDPAYNLNVVLSQSAYNFVDTLKDGNGRYLLQDSISSPSGKTLLGLPVQIISDNLFGENGEAHGFIGDAKRFLKMFNRYQVSIGWVTNDTFGRQLMGAMRFDTKVSDTQAGYFVTFDTTPKV